MVGFWYETRSPLRLQDMLATHPPLGQIPKNKWTIRWTAGSYNNSFIYHSCSWSDDFSVMLPDCQWLRLHAVAAAARAVPRTRPEVKRQVQRLNGFDSGFLQRNKYSMGRQETIAYRNSFPGWMILGTRKGGRTQNKPSRRIIVYDFFATPSPDVWAKRTRRQMSSQIDWWQRYPSGRVCQSWRTFCHCWSLK